MDEREVMTDTEILRLVVRHCVRNLAIATSFYDAATVVTLEEILDIILSANADLGGDYDSHLGAVSDS